MRHRGHVVTPSCTGYCRTSSIFLSAVDHVRSRVRGRDALGPGECSWSSDRMHLRCSVCVCQSPEQRCMDDASEAPDVAARAVHEGQIGINNQKSVRKWSRSRLSLLRRTSIYVQADADSYPEVHGSSGGRALIESFRAGGEGSHRGMGTKSLCIASGLAISWCEARAVVRVCSCKCAEAFRCRGLSR